MSEIVEKTAKVEEIATEIVEVKEETSVLTLDLSTYTLEALEAMNEKEFAEAKASVTKMILECKEAIKVIYAYERKNTITKLDELKTKIGIAEKYLRIGLYAYVAYAIYKIF